MSPVQALGPSFELHIPISFGRTELSGSPVVAAEPSRPSAFARALSGLGEDLDQGEALLASVASGVSGRLGPAELIALQAGIYRYTEAVDLAAKLVDRAASAVRTTLQASGG